MKKLSKTEMKKIIGGDGQQNCMTDADCIDGYCVNNVCVDDEVLGCPTYGCGAGGNGTCVHKVIDGKIRCACSDERGGICYF